MRSLGLPLVALMLLSLDGSRSVALASGSAVKACSTGQLSLGLDDEGGNFAGMSHSGTLLVLRNLGPEVCSVPARAAVGFEDAQQHPIHVPLESPWECIRGLC